jgi:hypothetical protein
MAGPNTALCGVPEDGTADMDNSSGAHTETRLIRARTLDTLPVANIAPL